MRRGAARRRVAIIALAAGVTALAVRDPAGAQLEREAARLAALLEAARSESRALGLPVVWRPNDEGVVAEGAPPPFRFVGLPATLALPQAWLDPRVRAEEVLGPEGQRLIRLGPEPLIGAQRIVLRLERERLMLRTDGLGPFVVAPVPA
ncbi:hypothetical protein ABXN37_29205, partial [Piscinibacter sakaiensis]|uniref:hypothetical protein n=1 Tax=Piscinibacter sakaiensis TaxID=1547922 RepID=UPI0037290C40